MELLAQAYVVVVLGTKLGRFGTLPQHGIDHWPKNANLIQVEANPRRKPPTAPRRQTRCSVPAFAGVTLPLSWKDEQSGAKKENHVDFYADRDVGTNLENPSFAGVVQSMGANGFRAAGPDQVGAGLKESIASGRPSVLEIRATQELGEPFRCAASKKPHRLLPKYQAYSVAAAQGDLSCSTLNPRSLPLH